MNYENAKDILPPELIEEIQKYAAGKMIYIPQKEEPVAWGSVSGVRLELLKRNQRIYNEYRGGKGVGTLAEEYFLSVETIKKIVYGKKPKWIPFEFTVENAIQYSEAGLDEEWIHTYYTKKYGKDAYPKEWVCDGLVKIPLRLIGVTKEDAESDSESGEPLIVLYCDGEFVLQGKRRILEQLKQRKINCYPAFIFVADKKEYATYTSNYGRYFRQAKFR